MCEIIYMKNDKTRDKEKAIIGCLLGTAIGDAMGLPYEGLSQQRLTKMYPAFDRYHFIGDKGMVSDDTEHTGFVAQSMIMSGGNVDYFKRCFAWKLRFWLLGMPAGIGWATLRAILKLWVGFSPHKSGVFSAGNGSAMRSAIIGVCYGEDIDKLSTFVRASTRITHTDPKAEFGAIAVALAAYFSSLNKPVSPQTYLDKLSELLKTESAGELIALIQKTVDSVLAGESTAAFATHSLGFKKGVSGYIYHTVPVVIHTWLRNQENYQQAILDIIGCGGDTDTTAAIVGGIIGANVGKKGIPESWLNNLWEFPKNIKWMEQLGQRLSQVSRQRQKALPVSIILVFLRNIIFMCIVLGHVFRRLLPPY